MSNLEEQFSRIALLWIGLLFFPLSLASPAAAETELEFYDPPWYGLKRTGNDLLSGCWVVRDYGPTRFFALIQDDGGLVIGIKDPKWLEDRVVTQVTLRVDKGMRREVDALATDDTVILIMGDDPKLIAALRAGNYLYLTGAARSLKLDLKGSSRALQRGIACARTFDSARGGGAVAPPPSETNPFKDGRLTAPEGSSVLTADQVTVLRLALILAGLKNPVMLDKHEFPGLLADHAQLSWREEKGGLSGVLLAWESTMPLHEMSLFTLLLRVDCDGQFESDQGPISRNSKGKKVLVAKTRCEEAGRQNFHHIFVYFDDDAAIAFVHLSNERTEMRADEVTGGLARTFSRR